jgi:predicted SnoaL-like aldol condensation-catalyzing enzyme
MKKLLFIISAGFFCLLISCNSKKEGGGMSEKAKKNLEASHIVNDAFKSGDPSKIDSVVASDFVNHTDRGDVGRDSLKAMISQMKKMGDMKMNLLKEFADDDYVFSQMEFTGTSNGEMGMPKGPYDMHAIQVVRFKDGKAVEHWEYSLFAEMMKMMPPPAKDTMMHK